MRRIAGWSEGWRRPSVLIRGGRFALQSRLQIRRQQAHLSVTTDQKTFYYKYTRELLKDGRMVKQKTWQETVSRDHQ